MRVSYCRAILSLIIWNNYSKTTPYIHKDVKELIMKRIQDASSSWWPTGNVLSALDYLVIETMLTYLGFRVHMLLKNEPVPRNNICCGKVFSPSTSFVHVPVFLPSRASNILYWDPSNFEPLFPSSPLPTASITFMLRLTIEEPMYCNIPVYLPKRHRSTFRQLQVK